MYNTFATMYFNGLVYTLDALLNLYSNELISLYDGVKLLKPDQYCQRKKLKNIL